jgi:glycerol uptake facilitator-like aquaporin
MKNFLIGITFSFLVLLCFILLRSRIGLWEAFCLSLFISTTIFVFYVNKKRSKFKEIILISIGTGIFYIIFASIGIKLYPVKEIRDVGDMLMPYLNAFIFGLCTFICFLAFGSFFRRHIIRPTF